ncbi:hypothetical protein pW2_120 [Bacillus phage pW2]|uniref:Uncharacterized protein n=1 Tax=Bacillus phage pW2 TaxID=2500559 RepID=A0A3T0IHN8_9CAUD|nr:transcriptional regulator [Bacillus phage pW2]AZU98952.1 hypothetical protein pW2_120 [Bacillus phage pW2]
MYMIDNFNNIQKLYGDASIQVPNWIFETLAEKLRLRNKYNIKQSSFAYAYVVTVAFLYKYAHFVDLENKSYIQNKDIKQILGYDATTKTIDKVIKKDGILDNIGLTTTTKEYPVSFEYTEEEINEYPIREFITINMLDVDDVNYSRYKEIVKNRNYTVKIPNFLFENDGDIGTLYNYNNTHTITLTEFIQFIYNDNFNNVDFYLYAYFKTKCSRMYKNSRGLSQDIIIKEMGLSKDVLQTHTKILEKNGFIRIDRRTWRVGQTIEPNHYTFKGIH